MNKTIQMYMTKSTKGTHVYATDEIDSPISSIYIKKSGLPSDAPKEITITLGFEETNLSEA